MMRGVRLAALVALLAAAAACAPLPRSGAGVPLRVMTYNIRSGNGDLAGTAAAIREQAPDVVALQEVDVRWAERSRFADQAAELGAMLHMNVRFAPIYSLPGATPPASQSGATPPASQSGATPGAAAREFGVALLSRFPIVSFRNDSIVRLSTQESNPTPAPAPGLLDVTLDVRGVSVRALVTHLDYRKDPSVRERQVREMLRVVGDQPAPTLLFGDLNATPGAAELQPLFARLHDAWSGSAEPGFTYPAEAPTERIDYVLVSRQFTVRSIRVPATVASDHRPVVAELMLR